MTLILVAFGTMILLASGLQLSRTTNVVSSYRKIANVQNIANNAVEVASCYFVDNLSSYTEDDKVTWSEAVEFISMLDSRSGLESKYWADFLSFVGEDTEGFSLTDQVNSFRNSKGLGEGRYNISSHIFPVAGGAEKYVVICSAEFDGTKRYSMGLVMTDASPQGGLPALRTVSLDRVLSSLRSIGKGQGNSNKIVGDVIFGDAIVAGILSLNDSGSSSLQDIIAGILNAAGIIVYDADGNQITDEETLANFLLDYFYEIEVDAASLYEQWVDEYEVSFPETIGATVTLNAAAATVTYAQEPSQINVNCSGATCQLESYSDELTIEVSGSDQFDAEFTSEGLIIYGSEKSFLVPTSIASETTVHIMIDGTTTFFSNQLHKISIVSGKYDIQVKGDVTIDTQFVYDVDKLVQAVNNGNGMSLVANKTAVDAERTIKDYQDLLAKKDNSYLRIASYGDISLGYSSATHGDKNLMGDFFALKREDGSGGNFRLGDLSSVPNITNPGQGQFSQLFLLGSITVWAFENPTYYIENKDETIELLNSLALVAAGSSGLSGSGSSSGEDQRFKLLGIQSW
jgi:hypothetical protein